MQNSGTWTVENGLNVWRLAVRSEGTLSWSFYLSRFVVPEGGELYVWNEDRTHYLGAFNHLNVKSWEGLALSLIEGTGAVLEYREPLGLEVGERTCWSSGARLSLASSQRSRIGE